MDAGETQVRAKPVTNVQAKKKKLTSNNAAVQRKTTGYESSEDESGDDEDSEDESDHEDDVSVKRRTRANAKKQGKRNNSGLTSRKLNRPGYIVTLFMKKLTCLDCTEMEAAQT